MADAHDERRIVTALFADVAGSTALSERLDPEEAKLVIGEAISRAIQAVEAYGGSINNLLGDGLLALFGAPVAHEDDPERAVRAGLDIIAAMHEYAEDVRRGWSVEGFAMRVGIHTGEVVVGQVGAGGRVEYGVVGDTVNTTARLQGAADSNGVLVSERTQRQVRDRFSWGEPRSLNLKGKSEPITAYPVAQIAGTAARAARSEPGSPMVGRDAEMSSALEILGRLAAGRGGVLYILGEPGIGKSRLAAELHQRALERNCVWMEGRCVSYGQSLPYWPYRDLLRNWLDVSPTEGELRVRVKLRRKTDEAFEGRGSEAYPYLATILGLKLEPEAADQMKALSAESIQYRTFEVFGELLERLAKRSGVVVCLDDLHWADPTSLALTDQLLSLTEAAPVLLAISQRPETDHPSWLLKEKAAREYRHRLQELFLQPLPRNSETKLLDHLAEGRQVPMAVTERLLAYAEGNPFYLEQIFRSLIDRGTLVPANGHWSLRPGEVLEIPQTLEGVILARIDRLEPGWRQVLTSASILGRSFGLDLLEAVAATPMPELRHAVRHLLRLDLFREEAGGAQPTYRFKHGLIQEAAYRLLVGPTRAGLHRRAAEWYARYYADRPERVYGLIAHHWLGTQDHSKAAHYLKLAGDRALAEWSLDEAVGHYRALVPLLSEAGRAQEAAETLFQLANALHLAMRYAEANETWQRAFTEWKAPDEKASLPTARLRIAMETIAWDADPAEGIHAPNLMLHRQLYDTLLKGRPGPYVVPGMAVRWEVSTDGRQYRFEIDAQARWNDGMPITAADVVESVRMSLDPATASGESARLSLLENADAYAAGRVTDFAQVGVFAFDDRTVGFRLHTVTPYWIFMLAYPAESGARAGRTNGPYKLAHLDGDRVVVNRDPGYRRPRAGNVAEVEWIPRTQEESIDALLRGEVDVVAEVNPTARASEAIASGRIVSAAAAPVITSCLLFTGVPPLLPDINLRKALAHAIDRAALARLLYPNQIAATGGLVPPGLIGHTPDTALAFDLDESRRYLAQSSLREPLRLAVHTPWGRPYFESLISGWREFLGLEIQVIDVAARDVVRGPEMAHASLISWIANYPDPEYFLHLLLHSGISSNISHWHSPAFDDLIDRARAEKVSGERLALFHEADRLAVQGECSVIPLIYVRMTDLVQPWVHGWWPRGIIWPAFDELTVDERSPRYRG